MRNALFLLLLVWTFKAFPVNGWLPYVQNVPRSVYEGGTQN